MINNFPSIRDGPTLHIMPKKNTREKTKKAKGQSLKSKLRDDILQMLHEYPGASFTIPQITKKLGLKKRDDIKQATLQVYQMEDDGLSKSENNSHFGLAQSGNGIIGIVDHVSSRFAYIRIGVDQDDVLIKGRDLQRRSRWRLRQDHSSSDTTRRSPGG